MLPSAGEEKKYKVIDMDMFFQEISLEDDVLKVSKERKEEILKNIDAVIKPLLESKLATEFMAKGELVALAIGLTVSTSEMQRYIFSMGFWAGVKFKEKLYEMDQLAELLRQNSTSE